MSRVTKEQAIFLNRQAEDVISNFPLCGKLKKLLLSVAGKYVCFCGLLKEDVRNVIKRGRYFPPGKAIRGYARGRCHENAANAYLKNPGKYSIVYGWYLCDDQIWREHSWLFDGKRVVETCKGTKVLAYVGYVLNNDEVALLIDNALFT